MKKKIILLFAILVISIPLFATNYYVKNSGNDNNTGLSDAQAWATISKINGRTFSAGDSILFKAGDVWREEMDIPSSGTSGAYIGFARYGTGVNPQILGSKATTTWTDQGSNVWKSDITFSNPASYGENVDIHFILTNGTIKWGSYVSSTSSLTSQYTWTWSSNYIYIYSTSNPASAYSGIEVPQRTLCIDTKYNEYLSIKSIDLHYSGYMGIDCYSTHVDASLHHGMIVDGCTISHIGGVTTNQSGYGISLIYSDLIIKHCDISECGRRGISMDVYGSGSFSNAVIEDNVFHDGWHTTGVDINVGYGSYTGSWDNVIIRRNLFYEPPTQTSGYPVSNQIFMQNYDHTGGESGGCTMTNVYIYSNIFKYPTSTAINAEGIQSVYVYNNTFYQVNGNQSAYTSHLWQDHYTFLTAKNNLFYCTASTAGNGYGAAIYYAYNNGSLTHSNNGFYRTSNSLYLIVLYSTSYYMNTVTNWEATAVAANPLFTDAANNDFSLQSSSTMKAAGTPIAAVDYDYYGNPFDATHPSLGAIQYGAVEVVIPTVTTTTATSISYTTATSGGNVTSSGNGTVTAKGICWSVNNPPTIANSYTSDGTGTGSYSSSLTGLSVGTNYYYAAYATNSAGTGYGSVESFSTSSATTPTVTTTDISNILTTSANSGGNITDGGGSNISVRGVCWNTSGSPTISNSHTSDGSGTGSYSSSITGLTLGTTYYVRAYATNSSGTSYGSSISFTTQSSVGTILKSSDGKILKDAAGKILKTN
jgi:hypothetical protein